MQRLSALTHNRFGLIRFRSPLLTESQLFSLPMGTKMFHFPTFPPTPLYIQDEVAGHNSGHLRGFPIRTSTDQSSFTNSPWLIAGYNVLHRLLMPRHPPIALSSLSPNQNDQQQNKLQKMLASTIQFSNNKQTPTNTHPHRSAHRLASSCCDPTTIVAEAPEPNNVPPPHPRQMPEPVPHPTGAVLDTRTPTRIRLGQCLPQFSHPTTHTTLGCERSHPGPVKTVGRRAP